MLGSCVVGEYDVLHSTGVKGIEEGLDFVHHLHSHPNDSLAYRTLTEPVEKCIVWIMGIYPTQKYNIRPDVLSQEMLKTAGVTASSIQSRYNHLSNISSHYIAGIIDHRLAE